MDTTDNRKPRVLVVDDAPDNLFLMTALLEDRCEVITAESGAEALAIAAGHTPPDLILLDVMMPGMDGHAVMRRLRQHPATARIPVVFLTASPDIAPEDATTGFGAVGVLAKPISPPLVLASIEAHATVH